MVLSKHESNKLIDSLASPKAVARDLNVTEGTLQVWRSTGRYDLPYIKIGGKVMYRISDVNKFIESRLTSHTQ